MGLAYNFPTGTVFQEFSGNTYGGLLAANTAQTLTVTGVSVMGRSTSGSQKKVVAVITVNSTSSVWVANNATPVVPSTTPTAEAGELVPANGVMIKMVTIGDVLSFITSGSNVQYGVAFYQAI